MAAAFKSDLGSNNNKTSGSSLVITTTAAIAVGDLVAVFVACDNLSATTPTITVSDSGGNSYTTHIQRATNATAAAGVAGAIACSLATSAVAVGGTITVTLSGSVTAKAAAARSFTGVDNVVQAAGTSSAGASTTALVVSNSVNSGNLVLAIAGVEDNGTPTYDTDTSGGSWSTGAKAGTAGGSAATNVYVAYQHKIATATQTQTYNLTNANTDWVACIVALRTRPDPIVLPAITNTSTVNQVSDVRRAAGTGEVLSTNERFFDVGFGSWTGSHVNFGGAATDISTSAGGLLISQSTAGNNARCFYEVACSPNDEITFEGYIQVGANGATTGSMQAYFFTSGNSYISQINGNVITPSSSWQRSSGSGTAPATTAKVVFVVVGYNGASTASIFADNLSATKVTGTLTIGLPLLTDSDSLFGPTLAPGAVSVTLPTFTDSDTLNSPTLSYRMTLPLITDGDSLFGPTVTPGAVTLTLPLHTDGDTLYEPRLGVMVLLPAISDADSLFGPTVAPGPRTLTLPTFTDADTLYGATITRGAVTLTLPVMTDADSLFAPTLAMRITLPLISDPDSLYGFTVAPGPVTVSLPAFTDGDSLYGATITRGPVTLVLPALTDADSLFGPTLSLGGVLSLVLPLITDADSLFGMGLIPGPVGLSLPYYSDPDTLLTPTITRGAVNLSLPTFTDVDALFGMTVVPGSVLLTLPHLNNANVILPPSLAQNLTLPVLVDGDTFYPITVTRTANGQFRVYHDGQWVAVQAKVWDGTQWVPTRAKVWNGAAWAQVET